MPRLEDDTLAIKFMSMHPHPVVSNSSADITEDDVKYESVKIINNKLIRSLDPRVCILPGQETTIAAEEAEPRPLPGSDPLVDIHNKFNTDESYTEGYVRNILVNINVVREAAKDAKSVNDFAMEILSQVSEACGHPWAFKVITNTALQQVMIIDENHKGDYKGFKEAADQGDTAYRFSGIGTNNICKDVKIQTKLPSEIQTFAYYAASGAGSSTGADINMFKLYGAGLRDRLKPNFKANTDSNARKEAKEQNEIANTWERYVELVQRTRTEIIAGLDKSKAYREGSRTAAEFVKTFIFDSSDYNPSYGPPIPIDISLTLNGISGIYMGNAIMLDTVDEGGMLPSRYKNIVALQATAVDQSISADSWTTSISTLMRPIGSLNPPNVVTRPPRPMPPEAVTVAPSPDVLEQIKPKLVGFKQYLNHTGIPYTNMVPQPEQRFYKLKGSQSNGLFKTQGDGEEYFSELIFPAFVAMAAEASKARVQLIVNDGWRSFEKQEYLYNGRKEYVARGETGEVFHPAARPGNSKHQTGISIDIDTNDNKQYKWLVNHAWKFGFKRNVAGEPWHWTYLPNQQIYGEGRGFTPIGHETWRDFEVIL